MIKPYGLLVAIGLLGLYFYCRLNYRKYRLSLPAVESALIWASFFALVGARIYHVLPEFSYYLYSPLKIFFIWEGGLGIFGAIIGGIIGLFLYCRYHKICVLNLLNLMAPPLQPAQAIGRIGNFFNHEGFGPPTSLPWKVFIPVVNRPVYYINQSYFHPTFFYESALCLLAFGGFLILKKKTKKTDFGFSYYLVSYGFVRLFTEFLRVDTWIIFSLPAGYLLSASMIALGIYVYKKTYFLDRK